MTGVFNINRRRFGLAGGIGFTALMVVLATLLMTGAIFASLPLAGIGGFVVSADYITGSGFELITNFADTNLGSTTATATSKTHNKNGFYPEAQIMMDGVKIYGLELSKLIDTRPFQHSSYGLPTNIDYVRIMITADEGDYAAGNPGADGTGLVMNATRVEAGEITLNTMLLDENMKVGDDGTYDFTTDHLTKATDSGNVTIDDNDTVPVGMKASTVIITNPDINGHYMTVDRMTLKGMQLWVQLFDETDVQLDPAAEAATQGFAPEPWPVNSNMN
ncbi:MAG: hypothetical protein ACOY46_11365 [Bacillota bacterium]